MYITKEGDRLDATSELLEKGGQLYPARHPGSPSVVLRGKVITTYWQKNSAQRAKVALLAGEFGLDPQHKTFSRLARWYVKEILQLPHKDTYAHSEFKKLAKQAHHWHYQFIQTGDLGYCFEVDLTSAYAASLLNGKSFLFDPYKGYLPDNGALDNLRHSLHLLPKPFRLQLLGIIAAHNRTFFKRIKSVDGSWQTELVSLHQIQYGAAFNAVHGAILRVYLVMKKLHEIGGEWIVRCHTDGLLIRAEIPPHILEKLIGHILRCGFEYKIKAEGRAYFFDLNSGFVGKQPYGSAQELYGNMKRGDVKYWAKRLESDLDFQWQKYKKVVEIPTDLQP